MIAPPFGRGRYLVKGVRSLEDRYAITLFLTVLTIGSLAAAGEQTGGEIAVALTGATLLFALRTSGVSSEVLRAAQVVVAIAVVGSVVALWVGDSGWAAGAESSIGFVIAAIVPVAIL